MCVLRGVRGALFILVEVGSRQMLVLKVIRRFGADSSSKCTWTGGRPGSADPGGRSAPPGHLSSSSSFGRMACGPRSLFLYAFVWRAHLLCHMGPPCKCVTPDAIFYIVVRRLLCVFVLFLSCSSEMYKTRKQLWSKVSDTNM